MKLLAALFVVGASVIALHAQAPTLVIRGRVVAADTGNPLPHARVVIYNDATPLPALFTDIDGRFAATPMANGRYRLSVTKAGYALTSITGVEAASPDGTEVRMPRNASIAGRVLDQFGEPAVGLAVTIGTPPQNSNSRIPAPTKVVLTNDLGEYRIGGLEAGTYLVAVNTLTLSATGAVTRSASYYPGARTVADAQHMTLQPGDQKSGIDLSDVTNQVDASTLTSLSVRFSNAAQVIANPDLQLFRSGPQPATAKGTSAIRGRITRSDGLPLAHATVSIGWQTVPTARGTESRTFPKTTTSDEDGVYELAELPAAEYSLRASKPGFTDAAYGRRVAVAENQTRTRIDMTLPRHSAIEGRIVDDFGDPVEGVAISISQIRFQAGRRRLVNINDEPAQTTDDLGQYRVFGLQPGQYIVTASAGQVADSMPSADVSGYASTYFPGTTSANEAQLVAVPKSQDVTGVDIGLVPRLTARISGKRLGLDGGPLAGPIVLTPSQRSSAIVAPPMGARTEDDGRFEFPNVPPGEYVIQSAGRGKSSVSAEREFVAQFVTVSGTDITDILLQATPGSTIRGRVVFDGDSARQPSVRNVSIVPMAADFDRAPNSDALIAQAPVGQDLTFTMTGIHGPRRIAVTRPPDGWALKSVIANGVDVTDMPLPFGTSEQSLDNVQVVFTSRPTALMGTVIDARGQASSEFGLLVFPTDRDQWYPGSRYFRRVAPVAIVGVSLPAGGFATGGLPPGDYFVAPVASTTRVLKDDADGWQDPEFLEAIAPRATRATLTEGQKLTVSARLISP